MPDSPVVITRIYSLIIKYDFLFHFTQLKIL